MANSGTGGGPGQDAALSALDTRRPVVFASAGVGITPKAGMLSPLAAARSGLEITLLHADEHEGTVARRRQVVSDVVELPNASLHVWYQTGGSHEPVDGVHDGMMNLGDVTLPDNVGCICAARSRSCRRCAAR